MPRANCNKIEIYYETYGDPFGPPVLLLAGSGSQLTFWSEGSQALVEKGFHVICPDHRDVGLSTRFDDAPDPDFAAIARGDFSSVAYTLDDMADDMVGLLDVLGIPAAHICGLSLGANIAQTMAIRHPQRVFSLVSIMSTTGDPAVRNTTPGAAAAMQAPVPSELEAYMRYALGLAAALTGPGYPSDEGRLRTLFATWYERGLNPRGLYRHGAAGAISGDRTSRLRSVTAPTVVIHGTDDPLVSSAAGKAVAAAIPGARLVLIPGMGHEFDVMPLMPYIVEALAGNMRRATAAREEQP